MTGTWKEIYGNHEPYQVFQEMVYKDGITTLNQKPYQYTLLFEGDSIGHDSVLVVERSDGIIREYCPGWDIESVHRAIEEIVIGWEIPTRHPCRHNKEENDREIVYVSTRI